VCACEEGGGGGAFSPGAPSAGAPPGPPPPPNPTRKLTLYARGGCLACSRPAPGHFNLAAALARRSKLVIFFALKL